MSRTSAALLFVVVAVVFGTAFPVLKVGLEFFPPITFAALRNYLAAIVLFTYVLVTTGYRLPRTRGDRFGVLAGGAFLVGGTGFGFVGQQYIPSGVAAIIFSLTPIITVVLAWLLLPEERLDRRGGLGVIVGFLGVTLVIRPDAASLLDPALVGKALFFVGVATVALGTVLVRRSRPPMPVTTLTAWSMLLGATILVVFAAAAGESLSGIRVAPVGVAALLYLVAVGAGGLVLFLVLMADVGATKANLTTYLTPVIAVTIGAVALEERLDPLTILGFGVILAGFVVLESRPILADLARYRTLFK